MELVHEKVLKIKILPVSKWAEKHGKGITNAAVNYLMEHDIIDYVLLGRVRYVVLTKKTLEYKPIKSDLRKEKNKQKRLLRKSLINV